MFASLDPKIIDASKQSNKYKNEAHDKAEKAKIKERLLWERKKKEEDKKTIMKNALIWGFSIDIANEAVCDIEKEITSIDSQIEELSQSSDIEEFLGRLPDILWKTFELSSKVLSGADIEAMKADILKLIEICTFELSINTKKELKVKLFWPLEEVLNPNGGRYRIRTYDPLRVKQVL